MSEHNYLSSSEFDAVFANCRRYWLNYGREIKRDGDVTLYRSGVDHSQLNGVMRIVGEDIDALVQESLHSLAGIPRSGGSAPIHIRPHWMKLQNMEASWPGRCPSTRSD